MTLTRTESQSAQRETVDTSPGIRRVLVFDRETSFAEKLTTALLDYGFEVEILPPLAQEVGRVGEIDPEILFIAVELPDRIGYTLFNRVKQVTGSGGRRRDGRGG
jgi:DNA-binding response OmpR family regulator